MNRLFVCIAAIGFTLLLSQQALASSSTDTLIYSSIKQGWANVHRQAPADLSGHWSERVFQWAIRNQIIEGYSDGTYQPDRPVVEAEFLLMLYRSYGVHPSFREDQQWSDSPYGLASMWKMPALGIENKNARVESITRGKAAEIIAGVQGVHYDGDDAIRYLLGNHLASGKTGLTIEGFAADDNVSRAEALQWIRNIVLNGVTQIQQRPTNASESQLIPTLPTETKEDLPDFTMVPITIDDLRFQDKDSPTVFPFGSSQSVIEAKLGAASGKNVFDMLMYGRLGVHYDPNGNMDAWAITEDGTTAVPPFQTSFGICVNVSGMTDVLHHYGTAGIELGNSANYLYEMVDGKLSPRFSRNEILHPNKAYVLSFNFLEKTKKVGFIYVSTYLHAYPY